MRVLWKVFLLLFCCSSLTNCQGNSENEAQALLQHLNANLKNGFQYVEPRVVRAVRKTEKSVEITLDLTVNCGNNVECKPGIVQCTGIVEYNEEIKWYLTQTDSVICDPIAVQTNTENPEQNPQSTVDPGVIQPANSILCLGCRETLDKDVKGIDKLLKSALEHIESEKENLHQVTHVISIQRQIQGGVVYILKIEVSPTSCLKTQERNLCEINKNVEPITCEVKFYQRPWISKQKPIFFNNCTVSQDYSPAVEEEKEMKKPEDNEVNLADLESQITQVEDVTQKPRRMKNKHWDRIYHNYASNFMSPRYYYYNKNRNDAQNDDLVRVGFTPSYLGDEVTEGVEEAHGERNKRAAHKIRFIFDHDDSSSSSSSSSSDDSDDKKSKNNDKDDSSSSSSSSDDDNDTKTNESDSSSSSSDDDSKPNKKDDDSSSSSSSSDDDDNDNEISNGDDDSSSSSSSDDDDVDRDAKRTKKLKQKNNGKDDDSSSSSSDDDDDDDDSSSSSSDDDNTVEVKKKNKKDDDSSSSSSSDDDDDSKKNNDDDSSSSSSDDDDDDHNKTDDSSSSSSDDTKESKDKKDNDDSSSSSSSDDDDHDNNGKDDDSSSSSDSEDEKSNKKKGSNDDSSSSSSDDDDDKTKDDDSSSSSSDDDDSGNDVKKSKKNAKGDDDDDDDSSSSSSDDDDDKNGKDDDDDSSSSSSDDDSGVDVKNNKKTKKTDKDDDSSSSSSDDDDDDDDENGKDENDSSSSSSDDDSDNEINNDDDDDDDDDDENDKTHKKQKKDTNKSKGDEKEYAKERKAKAKQESYLDQRKSSIIKVQPNKKIVKRSLTDESPLENVVSNDKHIISKIAKKAAGRIDDENTYVVKEILNSKKTQLEGTVYYLTTKVGILSCPNNIENCDKTKDTICNIQAHVNKDEHIKIVKVDCNNREKRAVKGGIKPKPVDDPKIQELAKETLAELDQESKHENKLKIVEVVEASYQTVGGSLYRIKIKIALSDCKKTNSLEAAKCGQLQGSEIKECHVEVYERPWEARPDYKETNVTCGEEHHNFRMKRDVAYDGEQREKRGLAGGINKKPVNDPHIQELAKESLLQLDGESTHENKYKVVEIVEASSQVVAGSLHRIKVKIVLSDCKKNDLLEAEKCGQLQGAEIKECKLKIWEKPWETFKETNVTCGEEHHNFRTKRDITFEQGNTRQKRGIPGGINKKPINDPHIQELAKESLIQLDGESAHENKYKVVEIVEASSQVVAGSLHRIKVKIVLSDCKKNDLLETEKCGQLQGAEIKECKLKIWEKPWEKFKETNVTCGEEHHNFRTKREAIFDEEIKREKRGIPGGINPKPVDDENIKQLAKDTLIKLDQESTHDNKYKVVEIVEASSQVVAGSLHRIKVKIVLSDCKKTDLLEAEKCGQLQGAEIKECNVKIWEKPWVNFKETNVTCGEEHHNFRAKRAVAFHHLPHLMGKHGIDVEESMFNEFITKYKKSYERDEYKKRFEIFRQNMKQVRLLNKHEQGTGKYGVTKFADLTPEEFSVYLGYKPELRKDNLRPLPSASIPDVELEPQFDWRTKNVVSEVKNQGACGSCWAFSVTGNIEGQYALKYGKLMEFSEQELVDCDKTDQGCNGGLMDNAYRAIEDMGGLETEQDYPYDAEDESCHFNKTLAQVQLSGAVNISQDETDMAKWLVKNGPISVALNANAMQFYVGGVSHPWKMLCNPKSLDHGVLIVGYGVHKYPMFNKVLPYWIIKNSWGKSWGEQGYYRLYRGDGSCGINQTPSSAIVA